MPARATDQHHKVHEVHELVEDSRGLAGDVAALMHRRRALQLFGGAGLLALAGCAQSATPSSPSTTAPIGGGSGASTSTTAVGSSVTTAAGATSTACETIPTETAGPFPGDGSNGPNVLNQTGIVRRDIRSSFGSSTTTAQGVPLTVTLRILEGAKGCAALAGAAVYVWQCDIDGNYSLYSRAAAKENYLRGVQEADRDGTVSFDSIFPGAYQGRWPHIHFEVYRTLADATDSGAILATSQLALPEDACKQAYAADGYAKSLDYIGRASLANDGVFRDGATLETPAVTGNIAAGFVATLDVTV